MISLICGMKGTGKTKLILEEAAKSVETAKGDIVFITDNKFETTGINFKVRVVYANEYEVYCANCFRGFIKGLFAGNADIEYLFVDGLFRIIGGKEEDFKAVIEDLEKLGKIYNFKAVLTVSMDKKDLPEFAKAYAK